MSYRRITANTNQVLKWPKASVVFNSVFNTVVAVGCYQHALWVYICMWADFSVWWEVGSGNVLLYLNNVTHLCARTSNYPKVKLYLSILVFQKWLSIWSYVMWWERDMRHTKYPNQAIWIFCVSHIWSLWLCLYVHLRHPVQGSWRLTHWAIWTLWNKTLLRSYTSFRNKVVLQANRFIINALTYFINNVTSVFHSIIQEM